MLTDFPRDYSQPSAINRRLTGHPKVDAIHHIRFEGDITPRSWYKHIVKQTSKKGEKKADRLAIDILSDIVYWYRPYEKRDEITGEVIGWRKRFAENLLQRNTKAFAEALNATERSVRASMRLLEELGLIRIINQSVTTRFGTCPNVMHIDINPEAIAAITYRPNPRQEAVTIEKPLPTKWECASYEHSEAETIEKSLLPKSVCASDQNLYVPVTKSVCASYEIGNSSIYRDYLEITEETSLAAEEDFFEEEEEPIVTPSASPLSSEEPPLKDVNQNVDCPPPARQNVPRPVKVAHPPLVSVVDRMDEIEADKEARRARAKQILAQLPNPFATRSQEDAAI